MEGRYAESQQSEERLEEEGSVSRSSRETGPAAASDFGAHSPRPARSQISTAVSFEPAHPATSAANGARSGEDSAASAAEPEGELSSLPQQPLQAAEQQVISREAIARPSGSLISTAMRPSAHAARQPRSPPAERATSVVSKTALRRSPEAVRAGTPASVYAQDRAPPHRALDTSPHDSQAMEQDSNEGRDPPGRQAVHHAAGSTAPAGGGHGAQPQRSEWQEAPVRHYDGAASQPPDSHASRLAPEAQQNSQEGMREGCLSAGGQENSIEAVQQGDMYPEDLAAAASVARSMPGMPLDQRLAGLPGAYQAALAAMAEGTMLERSASASSERHAEPQRGQADYSAVSMLATAIGQSLQQARPSSGQDAWTVTGHRNPAQAVQQQASAAQHAPDGFSMPALPTNSPFHSLASRYPAMLDALLRSDHGLTAPAVAQTVRQELAHALLAHLPAPVQQHHSVQAERVASTRAPNGNPGGFDGAVPPNGGSNEPSGMPPAAGSNENRASQQSLTDFMQQRLHTAGSLARPAEGELQDPRLGQHGPALGSPPMEEAHPAEVLQRPAGVPASGQSRQLAGRDAAPQEAHSGAVPHRPPSAERLHGADSGAMPALSIIRGLSGPFPASALPGHANAFQRRAQAAAERAPAAHPQGSMAHGKHAAPQQRNSIAQSPAFRSNGPGQQSRHGSPPPHANLPAPADTAHAAASVHATVMSEEDAVSEGETHLSSRRAAALHSAQPRRAEAHACAYAEERQASHHTAGLAQEQMREAVGTPVRQEMARPVDSTTAMAAAVAPTASCEQSVEMCPHGSPSAEAIADDPANSSDSSPARALTCNQTSTYKSAGQVYSAPARLHQTGDSGARPEIGGGSLPNGLFGHRARIARAGRDAYDAGPQTSNGTTMGQALAAGPQSAQPEGSLGSHAAVEQPVDKEASPAAGGHHHMATSAQGARPAASANTSTHLPRGCPPLPRGAQPGSIAVRGRPSAPPFAAGLTAGGRAVGEGLRSGAHDTLLYTGSSPLQAPLLDAPHQAAAQDADMNPAALSGARPAYAMVLAGAQSVRGSPAPGHEMQSQPMPHAHHQPEPQPALTVVMPSGCLPHVSEGRGESQPAAHSPEFLSQNMRGSGGAPNGTHQNGAARSAMNGAHAHGRTADHMHSVGHAARTEGAPGVHDVLSGEDSAPDTGRAVTSPAPGSTPGRRRNSIGKRRRVSGRPVDQPRSRYSATQCS